MITPNIDTGQIIISVLLVLITIVGWFIKRDITSFGHRLDKHDEMLYKLARELSQLMGHYSNETKD